MLLAVAVHFLTCSPGEHSSLGEQAAPEFEKSTTSRSVKIIMMMMILIIIIVIIIVIIIIIIIGM